MLINARRQPPSCTTRINCSTGAVKFINTRIVVVEPGSLSSTCWDRIEWVTYEILNWVAWNEIITMRLNKARKRTLDCRTYISIDIHVYFLCIISWLITNGSFKITMSEWSLLNRSFSRFSCNLLNKIVLFNLFGLLWCWAW